MKYVLTFESFLKKKKKKLKRKKGVKLHELNPDIVNQEIQPGDGISFIDPFKN